MFYVGRLEGQSVPPAMAGGTAHLRAFFLGKNCWEATKERAFYRTPDLGKQNICNIHNAWERKSICCCSSEIGYYGITREKEKGEWRSGIGSSACDYEGCWLVG